MTTDILPAQTRTEVIAFGLSSIELYYLLDYLKIEGLYGISRSEFDAYAPDLKAVLLAAIQKCLVAREFLQDIDGSLKISPVVMNMLAPHLAPTNTVYIYRGDQKIGRLYCFHRLQTLYVLRWSDEQDIHHFVSFAHRDDWSRAIIALLELQADAHNRQSGLTLRCAVDAFTQVRAKAYEGDRVNVELALKEIKADAAVVQSLANTLCQPLLQMTVVAAHTDRTKSAAEYTATLVQGTDATWILLRDVNPRPDTMMTIRHMMPGELEDHVKAFLNTCQ